MPQSDPVSEYAYEPEPAAPSPLAPDPRTPGTLTSEAIASLRATRAFDERPVPRPVLLRILEAARWTGSARNRQPWHFTVVTDPALRRRLGALSAYAAHLAQAPVVVLLAVDREHGGQDAEFDAGRAAQNLMLAAHSLGIGSCPASFFPDEAAAEATRLAAAPAGWRVRTAVSLGYPRPRPRTGTPAIPTGRRALDTLVTWHGGG
ncbi:nitroreductase family protein [Streptomyces iconiensis]|uniref:Nitroreductase family protein n=1 Tax=Streptomyces iconiensis TaxID=1384038 RepID=A0ABT6ZVC5_9ACTN|nr:nitroreductase family protein [Streptomyces iconiensis]MDJ1133028.1 nitroreductase family protein [Streptomyces iconiensis]